MTTRTRVSSDDGRMRAYAALGLAIAGIAWSAILVRWAGVPGTVSALYRVGIAGAVLVTWRLARGSASPEKGAVPFFPAEEKGAVPFFVPRAAWIAIAGGVFFALDLALWNTAVLRTQAAVASILGNNTPIFVGIMSWAMLRRRPRPSFWLGLALALSGCLAIMAANLNAHDARAGSLSGDLLALAASVFFAAYLLVTERVRQSMDTLTFNALSISGSVATLAIAAVVLRLPLAGFDGRTWTALIALGLVSQLMAYYALVYALGHLPATITSVGLLAQVPCTAALAWLLLDEPLSPVQIAGGVVVLAGIYVVNRDT